MNSDHEIEMTEETSAPAEALETAPETDHAAAVEAATLSGDDEDEDEEDEEDADDSVKAEGDDEESEEDESEEDEDKDVAA